MKKPRLFRWLLWIIVAVILLSPLFYWATGLGQNAAQLSAQITRQADGTLVSSPKAETLHNLSLPMRIQRMVIYPLLLLAFQFSGASLALRRWVEARIAGGQRGRGAGVIETAERQGGKGIWVKNLLRSSAPAKGAQSVLLFVLIFELALSLLYLPFNFYRSFIVGHQFGLSTLSAAGWFNDWFKGMLINLGLESVTWAGLYGLMRWLPRRWPLPAGALLVIFSGVLVLLEPILITPLFYQVRPLEDAQLRARIVALAEQAGMQVEAVEVIDASSKTTEVNAYFTGFGGVQRIVLYDNLLTDYTPDQIEVVLAHEMGHWYYQHVLLSILGVGATGWLGLFALRWLLDRAWRPLGLSSPADIAGLPLVLAIIALVSILALPIENGISRFAEGQADQFALEISQKPAAMVELFEKFAVQNLSLLQPPGWEKVIFYTHPPLAERIRLAEGWEAGQ